MEVGKIRGRSKIGVSTALSLLALCAAHPVLANEPSERVPASGHNDIVVTGSRIALPELAGIEPIASIAAKQVDDFAYSHFADGLDDFPGFRGSTRTGPNVGRPVTSVSIAGSRTRLSARCIATSLFRFFSCLSTSRSSARGVAKVTGR